MTKAKKPVKFKMKKPKKLLRDDGFGFPPLFIGWISGCSAETLKGGVAPKKARK